MYANQCSANRFISFWIVRDGVRQDLQRHVPVELGVSGPIHFAHAAFADLGGDVVVAESGADGERHAISAGNEAILEREATPRSMVWGMPPDTPIPPRRQEPPEEPKPEPEADPKREDPPPPDLPPPRLSTPPPSQPSL